MLHFTVFDMCSVSCVESTLKLQSRFRLRGTVTGVIDSFGDFLLLLLLLLLLFTDVKKNLQKKKTHLKLNIYIFTRIVIDFGKKKLAQPLNFC